MPKIPLFSDQVIVRVLQKVNSHSHTTKVLHVFIVIIYVAFFYIEENPKLKGLTTGFILNKTHNLPVFVLKQLNFLISKITQNLSLVNSKRVNVIIGVIDIFQNLDKTP